MGQDGQGALSHWNGDAVSALWKVQAADKGSELHQARAVDALPKPNGHSSGLYVQTGSMGEGEEFDDDDDAMGEGEEYAISRKRRVANMLCALRWGQYLWQ